MASRENPSAKWPSRKVRTAGLTARDDSSENAGTEALVSHETYSCRPASVGSSDHASSRSSSSVVGDSGRSSVMRVYIPPLGRYMRLSGSRFRPPKCWSARKNSCRCRCRCRRRGRVITRLPGSLREEEVDEVKRRTAFLDDSGRSRSVCLVDTICDTGICNLMG